MQYYQKHEIKELLLIPPLYILVHFPQQVFRLNVAQINNRNQS